MKKIFIGVLHHNCFNNFKTFINNYIKNVSLSDADLFILDNGSSEDVYSNCEIFSNNIKEHYNFNLLKSDSNTGVIGGRNLLFDIFSSESNKKDYAGIMFLDDDQFITSKSFIDKYNYYHNIGYDLIGYEAWCMNKSFYPKYKVANIDEKFTYVGCGGMFVSKTAFDILGKFDERFNPCYFEDPDYNFRAIKNGLKVTWIPKLPIIHKAHSTLGKRNDKKTRFMNSWNSFSEKWSSNIPDGVYLI
jgi:GT2 family glycosyltransferase